MGKLCLLESPVPQSEDEHSVRLYTVKGDGSGGGGAELLRRRDVAAYLSDAERDADSVVVTEQVPDCVGVTCITVLRRAAHSPSDIWLRPYTHDTVVPPGLRVSTDSRAASKVSYPHTRGVHGNGEDWDPMDPRGFPWEWK